MSDLVSQAQANPFQVLSWIHFDVPITDVCPPAVPPPPNVKIPNVAISSPNMAWVPNVKLRPFSLRANRDGRFGRYDPTVFPQLLPPDLCWYAAVRVRPKDPLDPLQELWWNVTENDFILDSSSVFCDIGKLTPDRIKRFQDLQSQLSARVKHHHEKMGFNGLVNAEDIVLKHTVLRLQMASSTFKDTVGQVAEFQRNYLLLLALLDYREVFEPRFNTLVDGAPKVFPVDQTRMGIVTSQPSTVQYMFSAGIPVWYLRSAATLQTALPCSVPEGVDDWVVQDDWMEGGEVRPFPTIYKGNPGPHLHQIIRLGSFLSDAVDVGYLAEATPALEPSSGPSRRSNNHSRRNTPYEPKQKVGDKGRDKFAELQSELLPPSISTWTDCMSSVIQDVTRIKPTASIAKGYRFPDPFMFVTATSERRAVFMTNWLSSRAGWIQAVCRGIDPSGGEPPHPSAQSWRDWLHQVVNKVHPSLEPPLPSEITKAKKRKAAASKLFKAQLREQPVVDSVFWREQQIMVGNLESLAPHTTAEILWDLFENNWRLELLALDRIVKPDEWKGHGAFQRDQLIRNVFPDDSYLANGIPPKNVGLAANLAKDRRPYIEAFRTIVSSWPIAPQALSTRCLFEHSPAAEILYIERACILSYCQTFYDHFGRAPITPHRIPLLH